MINKKINKKSHQLGTILIVIVLIISIFSIGFYTEGNDSIINKNIQNGNEITAAAVGMERVTGF